MLYEGKELEMQALIQIAGEMCVAARTAPKGKGQDTLRTIVLTGEEKEKLALKIEEVGLREMGDGMSAWYGRDAANVRAAGAVIMIGAKRSYRAVPACGYCGFKNCAECRNAGGNCAFAYIDLGIAVSSAAAVAAGHFVDNRIMYSIGKAAEEMEGMEDAVWLGIPVSVSGKNIFFDRSVSNK